MASQHARCWSVLHVKSISRPHECSPATLGNGKSNAACRESSSRQVQSSWGLLYQNPAMNDVAIDLCAPDYVVFHPMHHPGVRDVFLSYGPLVCISAVDISGRLCLGVPSPTRALLASRWAHDAKVRAGIYPVRPQRCMSALSEGVRAGDLAESHGQETEVTS